MSMMTHMFRMTADVWSHDPGLTSTGQVSTHYHLSKSRVPCLAEKTQEVRYDNARATNILTSFWRVYMEANTKINEGDQLRSLKSSDDVVLSKQMLIEGIKLPHTLLGNIDHLELIGFDYADPGDDLNWPPPGL